MVLKWVRGTSLMDSVGLFGLSIPVALLLDMSHRKCSYSRIILFFSYVRGCSSSHERKT